MLAILLETLPFFAVIALGYGTGRLGAFPAVATGWLTKFVFYFALSAMLFRFSAAMPLGEVFDGRFVAAYVLASGAVYLLVTVAAMLRRLPLEEAAIEAQCGVIGNTGFLGVPMLTALLGDAAVGPVVLVLGCDLVVFGTLIVVIITGSRGGGRGPRAVVNALRGLTRNPMLISIALGFAWAATGWPLPEVAVDFLVLLGAAATPGALFAIGASLADKSAERLGAAVWLSFAKLLLHPLAVAVAALVIFGVDPFAAGVMIAAASLPVAGNTFILAQHYGVAPQRVSATILISTAVSIVTVTATIAFLAPLVSAG